MPLNFPKKSLLIYSANGLSNAVVFNGIDDEIIKCTEHFIRSELLPILQNVAGKNGQELDSKGMELFYGQSFASRPGEFKFTLGEKILITQIMQHVAQKGFKYFAVGKKKMNMSKLIETAVGLIFGAIPEDTNREKSIPTKFVKSERSTENYEQKLLASANKVTNKRLREIGKAERVLTADLVQIDESIDANIKGHISCVFCKKMKKVSFKQSAGNWIMSNFIDHLRKCSENVKQSEEGKEVTSTSKCDLILTEPKQILPVTLSDDGQTHNNQSPQKRVFLTDNLVRQLSL